MDKLVGIFCQYTPRELFDAAGIRTVTLGSVSPENIPLGESCLPKNLCPMVKASLGDCLSGKDPIFSRADLIVGETGCDGKKKMFEILCNKVPFYMIQVPQGTDRAYALPMWKNEVRLMKEKIESFFGVTITDEALRRAVIDRNALRRAKMRLMDVQKSLPASALGSELFEALMRADNAEDIRKEAESLNLLAEKLEAEAADRKDLPGKNAIRILITGCPLGGVYGKTLAAVEENGGSVVCIDSCHGIRNSTFTVDPDAEDLLGALAEGYIQIGCAIMDPATRRAENLRRFVKEYRADGILDVTLQTCHCYTVDSYFIRKLADELGVSYMTVETDYLPSDAGQLRTRIGAFLESI